MKSGIYQLKSKLTGKIYIGLSKDVYYRGKKHLEMLRSNKHFNKRLQNHFNKYGDDLEFSVVEFCEQSKLEEREIFWIKELNSIERGFNFSEGGKLKNYCSKRFDFENIVTGKVMKNSTVKDLVDYDKRIDLSMIYKVINGKNHTTFGWKIMGRKVFRKKAPLNLKMLRPIKLKNCETGEVREFPSQIEAARQLSLKQGSISHLFNGKRKYCGKWEMA